MTAYRNIYMLMARTKYVLFTEKYYFLSSDYLLNFKQIIIVSIGKVITYVKYNFMYAQF